jgi:hypothetical protein
VRSTVLLKSDKSAQAVICAVDTLRCNNQLVVILIEPMNHRDAKSSRFGDRVGQA